MADEIENVVSQADSIIEIPQVLSVAAVAMTSTDDCDNAQTDCDGCLGAPCQGNNCETACQSACLSACQSACQDACQETCELAAQYPTSYGSISITSKTATSISLRLGSISKATYYVVAYRPSYTSSADTYRTTSRTVTIGGLDPDTTYVFNYYGGNDYGTGPYMPSGVSATTLPPISEWEWWSTIKSGEPIAVTAAEWNAFTNRINEFLDYYGVSQRSFTAAVSGTEMKADLANAARSAIGALKPIADSSYDPGWVNAGDDITAAYFIGLKNYLNSAMP